jgi:hypothetical protein
VLEILADTERHLERSHAQLWALYREVGFRPQRLELVSPASPSGKARANV